MKFILSVKTCCVNVLQKFLRVLKYEYDLFQSMNKD